MHETCEIEQKHSFQARIIIHNIKSVPFCWRIKDQNKMWIEPRKSIHLLYSFDFNQKLDSRLNSKKKSCTLLVQSTLINIQKLVYFLQTKNLICFSFYLNNWTQIKTVYNGHNVSIVSAIIFTGHYCILPTSGSKRTIKANNNIMVWNSLYLAARFYCRPIHIQIDDNIISRDST